MADGTRIEMIDSRESYYGSIKIVDYSYGDKHLREMIIDGLVQGSIDVNDHRSIYEYTYFLEWLPYTLNTTGKTCLMIRACPVNCCDNG